MEISLTGDRKQFYGAVVVHPTSYDACVELASLQLGLSVMGSSSVQANFQCAKEMAKGHLLEVGITKIRVIFIFGDHVYNKLHMLFYSIAFLSKLVYSIAFCNRSCSGLESGPKSYGQSPTSLSQGAFA